MSGYRFWTTRELAYLREHYPTKGGAVVGRALGRPTGAVNEAAARYGVLRTNWGSDQTLESIRARCDVHQMDSDDDMPGCWLWSGSVTASGTPRVRHDGKMVSARNLVFLLARGRQVADGHVVRMTCGHACCLYSGHMLEQSRAAMAAENALKAPPLLRSARRAAVVRARTLTKLTMEDAREIRLSDEPAADLAARKGVNVAMVRRIRRGTSWIEYGASAQLGGRDETQR